MSLLNVGRQTYGINHVLKGNRASLVTDGSDLHDRCMVVDDGTQLPMATKCHVRTKTSCEMRISAEMQEVAVRGSRLTTFAVGEWI